MQDFFHQQYHMYTDEKCFERGERDIFNKIVARLYMGNLALSRETTLPIERTRCSGKLFVHWVFSKYVFSRQILLQDSLSKIFKNQQNPCKISRTKQNANVWNGKGTRRQTTKGQVAQSHSFISKAKFNESFPQNQTIQLNSSCKSFKMVHGMS